MTPETKEAFETITKPRLLQVAEHLEEGQLSVDEFDFSTTHYESDCSTLGCAVGEFPAIWPNDWELERDERLESLKPHLNGYNETWGGVSAWLHIDCTEASHLFIPYGQITRLYGG